MHPLAVASGLYDPAVPKVGKMPGDQRLAVAQSAGEITHSDLAVAHEIQQAESGLITESEEERGGAGKYLFGVHDGKDITGNLLLSPNIFRRAYMFFRLYAVCHICYFWQAFSSRKDPSVCCTISGSSLV